MDAATPKQWVYLAPNPKSYLRQLFVKGTDFTAHDLFVLSVDDEEPMTKEQISKAYGVPEGAVEEAIAYAQSDPPEIRQDIADSDAWFAAHGYEKPPLSTTSEPSERQRSARP
jgi:hypothetical protein